MNQERELYWYLKAKNLGQDIDMEEEKFFDIFDAAIERSRHSAEDIVYVETEYGMYLGYGTFLELADKDILFREVIVTFHDKKLLFMNLDENNNYDIKHGWLNRDEETDI